MRGSPGHTLLPPRVLHYHLTLVQARKRAGGGGAVGGNGKGCGSPGSEREAKLQSSCPMCSALQGPSLVVLLPHADGVQVQACSSSCVALEGCSEERDSAVWFLRTLCGNYPCRITDSEHSSLVSPNFRRQMLPLAAWQALLSQGAASKLCAKHNCLVYYP